MAGDEAPPGPDAPSGRAMCEACLRALCEHTGFAAIVVEPESLAVRAVAGRSGSWRPRPADAGPGLVGLRLESEESERLDALARRARDGERVAFHALPIVWDGQPPILYDGVVAPAEGSEPGGLCVLLRPALVEASSTDPVEKHRWESIGMLAGGIAHDFNNLLTGVVGQVSLSLAMLPEDSPARRPINKAAGAATRAAELTRQLLAYAGQGQFEISQVDLNTLVIENIGWLETTLRSGVQLDLDLAEQLPALAADRVQIQQVLMNLARNAAEAVADGPGTVTVATALRDVEVDAAGPLSLVGGRSLPPQRYAVLRVTDTGPGMDTTTLERMFDPFFTTKGSGRGLGLSAVLGVIHAHGGDIGVDTAPGAGTTIEVYLPVRGTVAGRARPTGGDGVVSVRRSDAHVLVVDDEAAVREATADMLASAGVRVIAAVDGLDGVGKFKERHAEIDLVLLDLKMPVMDGEAALAAIREIDPRVRVVLMSGYSERSASERFVGKEPWAFLPKPFDLETLLALVARARS